MAPPVAVRPFRGHLSFLLCRSADSASASRNENQRRGDLSKRIVERDFAGSRQIIQGIGTSNGDSSLNLADRDRFSGDDSAGENRRRVGPRGNCNSMGISRRRHSGRQPQKGCSAASRFHHSIFRALIPPVATRPRCQHHASNHSSRSSRQASRTPLVQSVP